MRRFLFFYILILSYNILNSFNNDQDSDHSIDFYYQCCIEDRNFCSDKKFGSRYDCLLECIANQGECILKNAKNNKKI
jgi:hypothetical protein